MPKIYEIATGEKGPGNIIDETVLSEGGATTATTPAFTDSRNLDTSTNTAPTVRRFKRKTTGTPAAGIGAGIDFEVQTGAANHEIGVVIQAVTTDVTAASEDFDLVFKTMAAGAAAAERLRVKSTGATEITVGVASAVGLRINNAAAQSAYSVELYNSTGTRQAYWGTTNNADYYLNAGFNVSVTGSLTVGTVSYLNTTGVVLGSTGQVAWTSGNADQSKDTGQARKAAGVTEANNGTKGSYTGSAFGSGSQTVAQLPAAATAGKGARSFVTDASATTFLSTVAGGGANNVPVVSDGTNWLIG